MNKIERYLRGTFKEAEKFQKESEKSSRKEELKSKKMSKLYDKSKNKTDLAMSIVYAENSIIFYDIKRLTMLLQMHIAEVGMLNAMLQKLGQKYPEIRTELEQNIGKKFDPLIRQFQEAQQVEDDINTKAKNREDKLGGMFG